MMPTPKPPEPQPTSGLRTSVEDVLRLVLARVDASRATPADVRQRLHDAGVTVTEEWATGWLQRAAELRERKTP